MGSIQYIFGMKKNQKVVIARCNGSHTKGSANYTCLEEDLIEKGTVRQNFKG